MIRVVMPSIAARRVTRQVTVEQWQRIGHDPIVVEQDPGAPPGHQRQTWNALAAIRSVGDHQGWVVYSEDDIDLHQDLPTALPGLLIDHPVTLWFRPRFAHHQPHTAPIANPRRWWGSQCVILPPGAVGAVLARPPIPGFDMHLRASIRDRWVMHAPPEPLVEHRVLPRAATIAAPIVSGLYTGRISAVTDLDLCHTVWSWLPARATTRRRTDPAAIAAALDLTPGAVSTALHDMERHGHAIRDRATGARAASWHRGTPIPEGSC